MLLIVILSAASIQSIVQQIETTRATDAAKTWVTDSNYEIVAVNAKNGIITIDILGTGQTPDINAFDRAATRVLWSEPTVKVRVVNGSSQILDPGD